jgi:hypothetical protein
MPDKVPENQLALDLQGLVDDGLVEFEDEAALRVRRYKTTPLAAHLRAEVRQRARSALSPRPIEGQLEFPSPASSGEAPCSHCGSMAGLDAGARCRQCHVCQPPYM